MTGVEQLLIVARTYAEREGVTLSTLSTRVFNDGKRLSALEGGADLRSRSLEGAMQWFSDNWPGGDWPSEIPRPHNSASEARA